MTDQKRTLALSTRQWRVLIDDNLSVLQKSVQQTENISKEGLELFCAHLDDMKMLAGAWFQVSVQPPVADPVAEHIAAAPQTNGATPPKKRRGRPSNAEIAARQAVQ